jgi:hypothetical protein
MSFMPLTHVAWFGDPGQRELAANAAHESGHALVVAAQSLRVYRVDIREHGELGGQVSHERGTDAEQLVVAVAGEIADTRLGVHDLAAAAECARLDRNAARELAPRVDPRNPDAAIRRASTEAGEFIGRSWWALERFARILLKHRVLEGDELNSLLRAALSGARDLWTAVEEEASEIAIGRRFAFERRRAAQPGIPQAIAWAEADREAREAWAAADRETTALHGAEPQFELDRGERLRILVAAMGGPAR